VDLVGCFDDGFTFGFDVVENRFWQRISETEGYEVGCAFFFPVWDVAAVADFYAAEAGARRRRDSRRDASATARWGA